VDGFGRVDRHPAGPALVEAIAQRCGAPEHAERNRALLPLLAPGAGDRVLEVGCGTGAVARELVRLTRGTVRVTAVDPSALALERARRETAAAGLGAARAALEHHQMDGRALAFRAGAFDAVCCSRVLNHAAEPERIVAEMARVTRPGGRVLCVESAAAFTAGVDDALRRRTAGFTDSHVGRELGRLVRRAGLDAVAVTPYARVTTEAPDVAALRAEFRAGDGLRVLAVRDGWCTAAEVERYIVQLAAAAAAGGFLDSDLHLAVLARRP
jgi:ubiquinone/menaquinone biosynthesis C-methylase UbiE